MELKGGTGIRRPAGVWFLRNPLHGVERLDPVLTVLPQLKP